MRTLAKSISDGIKSEYTGRVCDWAEQFVSLPHSARSTKFDKSLAPWLNDPLDECVNTESVQVVICAPTGGAKTTLLEVLIPYIISQAPGPMMITGQTDETSDEWVDTRLMKVLEACEPVRKLFPKDRHKIRKSEIIFSHMPLLFGGANISNLQEKSMRYCFGDEVWRWKSGMVDEMKARHHDRWNRKTILASQGSDDAHDFAREFRKGDCREYGWPCPECSKWNQFKTTFLKYDEILTIGKRYDVNRMSKTARMECAHCGHQIENTPGNRRALSESGRYEATNHESIDRHSSIRWSITAVWWVDWADLVAEWIEANNKKHAGDLSNLKIFTMKRMPDFWKEEETTAHGELIGADYSKSDYSDGQKWDGEAYRFLSVDKQRDHFWVVIRVWKTDGSSRLIWEGKILTFEMIRDLQNRMKVIDGLVLIDAQYDTHLVYEQCAKYGWTAAHGSGEEGFRRKVDDKWVAFFFSEFSRASLGGGATARYFHFSDEKVKDKLAQLRSGQSHPWDIPKDISPEYAAQIDSEVKRDVINKTTKAVKQRWVKIASGRPNHMWDCEMIQVVAAMMMKILKGQREEDIPEKEKFDSDKNGGVN